MATNIIDLFNKAKASVDTLSTGNVPQPQTKKSVVIERDPISMFGPGKTMKENKATLELQKTKKTMTQAFLNDPINELKKDLEMRAAQENLKSGKGPRIGSDSSYIAPSFSSKYGGESLRMPTEQEQKQARVRETQIPLQEVPEFGKAPVQNVLTHGANFFTEMFNTLTDIAPETRENIIKDTTEGFKKLSGIQNVHTSGTPLGDIASIVKEGIWDPVQNAPGLVMASALELLGRESPAVGGAISSTLQGISSAGSGFAKNVLYADVPGFGKLADKLGPAGTASLIDLGGDAAFVALGGGVKGTKKTAKAIHERLNTPEYTQAFMKIMREPRTAMYASVPGGAAISKIITAAVEGEKALKQKRLADKENIPGKEPNIPTDENINERINTFMKDVAGYSIEDPTPRATPTLLQKVISPVTKPFSFIQDRWSDLTTKSQNILTSKLEEGLTAQNPLLRNATVAMQGVFKNIARAPETVKAGMQFSGGKNVANSRAYDVGNALYDLLDVKKNPKSLERINAVLDPELAKEKVKMEDLTPTEAQVYTLVRRGLDLVHDINYKNGDIPKDIYDANRGKYVPRMYDTFELPKEMDEFINAGQNKLFMDMFKSKKDIDQAKIDANLADPVYGLMKRFAQTETNTAIKQFLNFIQSKEKNVSDTPKKGYTQLSDSKGYGPLAGKYVANHLVEELHGFFYTAKGMDKFYDLAKAYDRWAPRQLQKKVLTVGNPVTHLGNVVSNVVFSTLIGVNPLTFTKNAAWVKLPKYQAKVKQYADYLRREGIVGSDITRADMGQKLKSIEDLKTAKTSQKTLGEKVMSVGKAIETKVTEAYSGADDVAKIAAFKSLLDQGKSLEQATKLVRDGFQNYSMVGKYYDVWAKTPIIGAPFVKFQGDLLRIVKNMAANKPLQAAGFLWALKTMGDYSSFASGETPEQRKIREGRIGSPMVPIFNIPLEMQTPIGALNAARYISPTFINVSGEEGDVQSPLGKMIPGGSLIDYATSFLDTKDHKQAFVKLAQDPLLGPIINLALDTDFRGKTISDPDATQYQPSTATREEKIANIKKWAGRTYNAPVLNSFVDAIDNLQGKADFYGRKRDMWQTLFKVAGVRLEQFGPEQVKVQEEKNTSREEGKQDDLIRRVNQVNKLYITNEIDKEQWKNRLSEIQSEKIADTINVQEEAQKNLINISKRLGYNKDLTEEELTSRASRIDELLQSKKTFPDSRKKEFQDAYIELTTKGDNGKIYTPEEAKQAMVDYFDDLDTIEDLSFL